MPKNKVNSPVFDYNVCYLSLKHHYKNASYTELSKSITWAIQRQTYGKSFIMDVGTLVNVYVDLVVFTRIAGTS